MPNLPAIRTPVAPAERGLSGANAPRSTDPLGTPLVPGQVIQPIDVPGALRLAGARDLDIAIARERICQAVAELEQARVLWLPSLYLGPNWIRHDGQVQFVDRPVKTISKSSLFLGATAAGGSSVTGPIPVGGPAQVSGLTTRLRISDAIFEPLAARQVVAAREAGLQVATNDALLALAEAYLDLQDAVGRIVIARDAASNAASLTELTASFVRSGEGLEADHRRSLTELDGRRKDVEAAVGQLEVASAELVRRIRLDPRSVVAPVEPPETVLHLIADGCSVDDLIATGLRHRPELAEAQALVGATLSRLKQARLRPLIPSVAFRYSGGGFGGGANGFFGNFDVRSDADVNLFWEVQNLGLADRAIVKSRAAQQRTAFLELLNLQDQVASDVVRADKARLAGLRQMHEAGRALPEALASLRLNLINIRRGAGLPGSTRPIEALQPIQALAQARADYLDAVLAYNRAQFRLYRALGQPPLLPSPPGPPAAVTGAATPVANGR
jgi:outer membrane protein TolC